MVNVEKLIEEVRKFPVLYDQTNDKYKNSEYKDKIWNHISTTLEIQGGIEECKKKWSSVRDQLRRTLQKRKTATGQAAVRHRKYKYEDILTFLIPHIVERDTLSNVPNSEEHEDEDDEKETTITDTQEEISEQTCHPQDTGVINEEPETEFQSQLTGFVDNTPKSTAPTVRKDKFTRPVASLKRKIQREGKPVDSPASQLMAYILAEKEEENKKMKTTVQDTVKHPVDAFLCGIAPTLKSLNPILLNQAKGRIFSIVQEFEMKQLMSSQDQDVGITNHFAPFSPTSSLSVSTLSTTTTPYPSPLSVEATTISEPVYYQLDGSQMQNLG